MKFFLLTLISIIINVAVGQDECLPQRCDPYGPLIRFPFRLKDSQPDHCGYIGGFDLSCNQDNRTELNLQIQLTASTNGITILLQMTVVVWNIDYEGQKMLAGNARARTCLPEKLQELKPSASLFEMEAAGSGDGYTLFNCSNPRDYETIPCLSSRRYKVVPFPSGSEITNLISRSSCFKMYNISYVPYGALTEKDYGSGDLFYLRWSRPSCGNCEAQGKLCRLRNGQETECFSSKQPQHGKSRKYKPLIIVGGILLVAFIMVASFFILRAIKRKSDKYKRIEKVLANHKNMRPRRYSYADIKKSTNNLKEKPCQGSLRKGMLSDGTPVAVKMINGCEQSIEDFITEVERIGQMQDTNVLQLIGYCIDGSRRALVYEFLRSGTLETLIVSTIGWERLHQIALGIAKGIYYLHNQQIFNLHISPQTILLDHNFNPKILVSTTTGDQGAIQYIAPEAFNVFSQKGDVYSFGMLWLNIIGRSLHGGEKEDSEVYLPDWFYNKLKNGDEEAIQVEEEEEEEEEEEGNEIVKKLLIVGLCCIQWFPSDRPSMKAVIRMLEGDNMPAIPPNAFVPVDLTQN